MKKHLLALLISIVTSKVYANEVIAKVVCDQQRGATSMVVDHLSVMPNGRVLVSGNKLEFKPLLLPTVVKTEKRDAETILGYVTRTIGIQREDGSTSWIWSEKDERRVEEAYLNRSIATDSTNMVTKLQLLISNKTLPEQERLDAVLEEREQAFRSTREHLIQAYSELEKKYSCDQIGFEISRGEPIEIVCSQFSLTPVNTYGFVSQDLQFTAWHLRYETEGPGSGTGKIYRQFKTASLTALGKYSVCE